LLPTTAAADLFGWVPDLVDWLEERVATAIAGLAAATAWLASLIADLFTWTWETTDAIPAGVRASIAVAMAIALLALAARKLRLLMLARHPRVQVGELTWADPSEESDAVWITSLFHQQLAALEVDPIDPLPERTPSAPFVDIVEGVAHGASQKADLADAAGRLLRALWPVAAYEVWGTLRPLPNGKGRISVQLIDRARGNRMLGSTTHQRGEWERGAGGAAMAIAGMLYPRVAKKHRGPWAHWKEAIPSQLIGAYNAAQTYEAANRFEEAMGACNEALEHDPLNPHMLLRIATLQERLGLYIDAWVTYGTIVDEPRSRAWKGPARRVRLVALFRLAILVSNGRTAKQWVKEDWLAPDQGNLRASERAMRRRELRMSLKHDSLLYKREPYLVRRPAFAASSALLSALLPEDKRRTEEERREWAAATFAPGIASESPSERAARAAQINAVLQVIALRRLEELDAWLRARPPLRMRQWAAWWRRRPRGKAMLRRSELARAAVRVSKLLVRIRIAADVERLAGSDPAEVESIRREYRRLIRRWPFPATTPLRKTIHFIAPRRRWANKRADAWQLHYNAACTAAATLREDSVLRRAIADGALQSCAPSKEQIVKRAVRELEEYAHRAGSGRVTAHADWVASGDPDLQELPGEEEFELWVSHYLPRDLPERRLSGNVDVNRYTARIMRDGAYALADCWRDRASRESAPAKEALIWWLQEKAAWSKLGKVCSERGCWQERLGAIQLLRDWLHAWPDRYHVNFTHETLGDRDNAAKARRRLLEEMAVLVGEDSSAEGDGQSTVLEWVTGRASSVQAAYRSGADMAGEDGLPAERERLQALKAAELWGRAAEALGADLSGEGDDKQVDEEVTALLQPLRAVLASSPEDKAGSA
jgi:tetratricopeptide (TPR) repeat protein